MCARRPSLIAVYIFVLFAAFGCGDPEYHFSEADDGSPSLNSDNHSSSHSGLELEATTETEVEAYATTNIPVGVRLVDDEGKPQASQRLDFDISTSTGDDDVRFDAPTVYTDDDGQATTRLTVGELTGTIEARVSHSRADGVDFHIEVVTIPDGDLFVEFTHDDADLLDLHDLDVRLWATSHVECDFIVPYVTPDDPPVDNDILASPEEDVLFDDIPAHQDYTVAVSAHGPEGQISGHGCIDEEPIEGEATTEVTVDIELLALVPTGSYAIESIWDMTEAITAAGPVGQAISDAFDWISDPTAMAADYMVGLAVDWVCDNYGSTACGYAEDAEDDGSAQSAIADFLDDQIASIGILADFQSMADDLSAAVETMVVESTLTIDDKAQGEGQLSGSDIWTGVRFEWPEGCTNDCEVVELSLGDDTDFGAIEADWEGRLTDYDQLEIDPHDMVVPYGQFITHILNEYLIPSLTGGNADTLSGAFEYLLCDNLDDFSIWGVSIGSSTLQDFCYNTFSTVGGLAEIYIDNLEYDVEFQVAGVGRMIDLESDANTDVIEDGLFFGEIEGQDGEITDLESEFSGERIP